MLAGSEEETRKAMARGNQKFKVQSKSRPRRIEGHVSGNGKRGNQTYVTASLILLGSVRIRSL